jgi:hypothetical protein
LVAWVKLNDLEQQAGGVVGIQTEPNVTDNFDSIVYGEWNKYHWLMRSTGFTRSEEASSFVEQSKEWVFMTITYVDNNYKIYRNGNLIGSTNEFAASFYDNNSLFYVGKRHRNVSGGNYYLNAVIDEARIYNRALTEAEVMELYNGVEKPVETGIVDLSVSITKPAAVTANKKATYKLTITNNSEFTATGVKTYFVVPGKTLVTVDVPKNCTASGRIIECTLADLAAKKTATQSLSMKIFKKGALNVGAAVSANEDDVNLDDNEKSAVISVK